MKSSAAGPRIVTLDIETAPLQSYHWSLWDQNISLNQIVEEWSILSFTAKWLDSKELIYKDTGGRGKNKVRDDKALVQELWNILNEADIVITQNGQSFDIPRINARMLMHGMKPYSPIKHVDTKRVASKVFSFTSNKLAWMSQHLTNAKKDEHKLFPGFELWVECLKDNPKAWKEMKKYNSIDVLATEELYLKMLPWIPNHPNITVYNDKEITACPKCNSVKLQKRGVARTQIGEYHRFQCQGCGGWCRGRTLINTSNKRKVMLG